MMDGFGVHGWGMGWGWIFGLIVLIVIIWLVFKNMSQNNKSKQILPGKGQNKFPVDFNKLSARRTYPSEGFVLMRGEKYM